jgi:hypothetical protein
MNNEVGFAIALLTPDDVELGYFWGLDVPALP